jgi:hypothetical protein
MTPDLRPAAHLQVPEDPRSEGAAAHRSAGFGGGGINGASSLEGTFLGGCVLTARVAAQAIAGSRAVFTSL